MTQLWNWQKYLHTCPALSILGISYMSAWLVIHWMLNMCLSEMLPKGPLSKEISAVFFEGSSWLLHGHYSCEPSQLKLTQMEHLDLGSFQSFMDQTQHCAWEPAVLPLLGPKTVLCFFFPDLVIITSKSMLFFGLNDLMEIKVLKKLNNIKLALIIRY